MSIMKRAMDFLGLGPDDSYDDYDMPYEQERPARAPRSSREPENTRGNRSDSGESDTDSIRAVPTRPSFPMRDVELAPVRRSSHDDSSVQPRPASGQRGTPSVSVRQNPVASAEPTTVKPRRFDQAQEIADRFKDGQPVIMNLESTDREVTRRLIDFASGLCYGLHGTMEKVASGVYLLKPASRSTNHDDTYGA
jgi:cell division inhibitor SepF